jgi:hypothetical protein
MKLVLHIGTPKTGTTSLQRFLYEERQSLSNSGYALFDDLGQPNNIHFAGYFSANGPTEKWRKRRGIRTPMEKVEYFKRIGFLQSLSRQIAEASTSHHTAIISSEQLSSGLSEPEIRLLANWTSDYFDQVIVVCYFREQVSRVISDWSLHVRGGGHLRLKEFVGNAVSQDRFNYIPLADTWSSLFGHESMHFHEYNPGPHWDIRREFAREHLAQAERLEFPQGRDNPAYRGLEAQVVRLVNSFVPYWPEDSRAPNPANTSIRRRVRKILRGRGPEIGLCRSQIKLIERAFRDSNQELFERFSVRLGRVDER